PRRANDPLSAITLATRAPVLLAPAMEDNMWHAESTKSHLRLLEERGARVVAPETGALASGREGAGRLAEPERILSAAIQLLLPQTLKGVRLLVTAGPTKEAIDPVRYLSNPSSGRMGYAIAEEAALRGASVTLVSGPTHLPTPFNVRRVDVVKTADMLRECEAHLDASDALIMAAAPADLTPTSPAEHKIKKTGTDQSLALSATPDILRTLGARTRGKVVIGFAAETRDLDRYAREKLESKDLDGIVGNLVSARGTGFESENNEGTLYLRSGEDIHLPMGSKREMATRILDWLAARLG
ncbi:MAG: bifunctional phosphopantothenoylcysteine decarboxylase/phosphopantothenate--cysteine ligase CoaBC, partial [Myxococcota bacterium]